jgi:hypothetical protein
MAEHYKIDVQRKRMAIRLQSSGSDKVLLRMVMNVRVRKNAGNLMTKELVSSEELSCMELITEASL